MVLPSSFAEIDPILVLPGQFYLKPHSLLRPLIAHYTVSIERNSYGTSSPALSLIPDASGCLVFTCENGQICGQVWGATTRVVDVSTRPVPFRLFVEFLPGGLLSLLYGNQAALRDLRLPLEQVDAALHHAICETLQTTSTAQELVEKLDRLFLHRLFLHPLPDAAVSAANRLIHADGLLSVQELSRLEHYSERHLNRLFRLHFGMGVKTCARLSRINAAIRLMGASHSLASLAQETGFYDQAHFDRDFHEICGVSPRTFLQNKSDFYKEPFKF